MTSRDFISWLDGFTEGKKDLNSEEINRIREKLDTVVDVSPSIVPLHPVPTPVPGSGDPYSPPYWVGDFPPFGGTTLTYSYTTNDKKSDKDEVDKKSDSKE
jgi:hypothetical protein